MITEARFNHAPDHPKPYDPAPHASVAFRLSCNRLFLFVQLWNRLGYTCITITRPVNPRFKHRWRGRYKGESLTADSCKEFTQSVIDAFINNRHTPKRPKPLSIYPT